MGCVDLTQKQHPPKNPVPMENKSSCTSSVISRQKYKHQILASNLGPSVPQTHASSTTNHTPDLPRVLALLMSTMCLQKYSTLQRNIPPSKQIQEVVDKESMTQKAKTASVSLHVEVTCLSMQFIKAYIIHSLMSSSSLDQCGPDTTLEPSTETSLALVSFFLTVTKYFS